LRLLELYAERKSGSPGKSSVIAANRNNWSIMADL
jgi:hypothetical protein